MSETEDIFNGCNKYITLLEEENKKFKKMIKKLERKNYQLHCRIIFLNKRVGLFTSPLKTIDECNSD